MKAAIFYGLNDIRIEEREMPKCPKGGLIMKVCYVTTCGTDVKRYKRPYAIDRGQGEQPIFGHEASGLVYETDEDCKDFKVGDRMVAHDATACGNCYWCKKGLSNICPNMTRLGGTWTEYIAVDKKILEKNTFKVPNNVPLELAPAVEPMACAMHCAEAANVRLGDYVVVNGAGPLGLGIIRYVSAMGAQVIACDMSEFRLEMAKKMGAKWTVHVTEGLDQVRAVRDLTPDKRGCDVAIEAVGLPKTWELTIPMARKGGLVLEFAGCAPGTSITVDTALLHYSELTIKGLFHTTLQQIQMAFDSMVVGLIPRDIMITGNYTLDNCVQALEDHSNQIGIKNLIKISEETL